MDKKKRKILEEHEPKGWVRYEAIPKLLREKARKEAKQAKLAASKEKILPSNKRHPK